MTNEQAIRHLEDLQRLYLGNEKFTADIETIGMAIKALEQTRWIPCAERLPEDYEDVLVCDGVDMFVGWCELEGLSKKWYSLDDNFEYDMPIIAWMPLPELYKAECEKGDI